MLDISLQIARSLNAQRATSAAAVNGTGVDISALEGPIFVHVNAPVASSADTVTFTVEHSEASGSGYAAVSSAILVSPSTGDPATFTIVTDAVTVDESLILIRDRLKRYVRVVATVAGTSPDVTFTGLVIGQKKYSG